MFKEHHSDSRLLYRGACIHSTHPLRKINNLDCFFFSASEENAIPSEVCFLQLLLPVAYRQWRRTVVFHSDSQPVFLLALSVRRRRPRHHLSGHAVHAEGQVLVPGGDVIKQHGIGAHVSVGRHHPED